MFAYGGLGYFLALAYALYDFSRRQAEGFWLFIIIFLPLGPFIYLAVVVLPNIGNTGASRSLMEAINPRDKAEYKRLRLKVRDDSPLGEVEQLMLLSSKFGKDEETIDLAHKVLERDPDSLAARYSAGMANARKGNHDEAIQYLRQVIETDPKYRYGMPRLALAETLKEAGRDEEALQAYEELLRSFSYFRGKYHYGELLHKHGHTDEARKQMEDIVASAYDIPDFRKAQDKPWITRAKRFLSRME